MESDTFSSWCQSLSPKSTKLKIISISFQEKNQNIYFFIFTYILIKTDPTTYTVSYFPFSRHHLSLEVFAKQLIQIYLTLFFVWVLWFYWHKYNVHMSCVLIFFTAQPGTKIGDSGGQLGCSLYNGFTVLGGDIVSSLSRVWFVA